MAKKIANAIASAPLPSGWEDQSQLVAVGPARNGFRPNLVVMKATPSPASVSALAKSQMKVLSAEQGFELESDEPAPWNSASVVRTFYFDSGGFKLGQYALYAKLKGNCVIAAYTHLRSELKAKRKEALDLLSKVRAD